MPYKSEKINYSKLLLIGISIVFLFIIIKGLCINNLEQSLLKSEFRYSKGSIVSFERDLPRNRVPAKYVFKVEGIEWKSDLQKNKICKILSEIDKSKILDTEFDIIYFPKDPRNNLLITRKEEYMHYKLEYPTQDSNLFLVLEEYFNCSWSFWRWVN